MIALHIPGPVSGENLEMLKRMCRLRGSNNLRPAYLSVRIGSQTILAKNVRGLPGWICIAPLKGNGEDRYPLDDVKWVKIHWRSR